MYGSKIRELRKEKGISQSELAKVIHVSQQTITAWENGKAEPSSSYIASIANFFGVSTDYLLGLSNSKTKDDPYSADLKTFLDKNLHHGMFYGGGPSTAEQEQQLEGALKAIYYEYYANEAELKEGDN